jgi:hypothetical protein
MEKGFVWIFALILIFNLVLCAAEWEDINVDEEYSEEDEEVLGEEVLGEEYSEEDEEILEEDYVGGDEYLYSEKDVKYNKNFYFMLGLGALGVLIILYIAYLIIRGPNVPWKKLKLTK